MKSRFAATSLLTLVVALMVAAPSFAISGSTSSSNAAVAQYRPIDPYHRMHIPPRPPSHFVPPQHASSSSLPFTGYAAIPVLLGGVALLGVGLVVRRRTGGGLDG